VGGRKLVGSAQWRDPGAVLQHGSILIADDQSRLAGLSGSRIAPAPVATVAELLGREPTIAEIARALRKALDDTLQRADAAGARDFADDGTTAAAASELRAQYVDDAWTWRH
jgi:lipoate-protein ligase A